MRISNNCFYQKGVPFREYETVDVKQMLRSEAEKGINVMKHIIVFVFIFLGCFHTDQQKSCPACTSVALHFAFFDSVSNSKIIPDTVIVSHSDTSDTIYNNPFSLHYSSSSIIDSNFYYYSGYIGNYEIIVKDKTYGDFTISSIIVGQNLELAQCGNLPLTVHMKIAVNKTVNVLNKKASSGSYKIETQYAHGSCGN
jgi:hypothetical protein